MHALFQWLGANAHAMLFGVVAGAVLLGRTKAVGSVLGTAGAVLAVGASLSALAATLGVKLGVDPATRSLLFCLFMFGLGLRIGPSLPDTLQPEGRGFLLLALVGSITAFAAAVGFAELWDLPAGSIAGLLGGGLTSVAALGGAEEAVRQGLAPRPDAIDVGGMLAVSFAITYVAGAVSLSFVSRSLAGWWGIDPGAAARRHEDEYGVPDVDAAGLAGLRPRTVRAYRLVHDTLTGWTVRQFHLKYPAYRVVNLLRIETARRGPVLAPETVPREEDLMALAAAGVRSTTRLRDPAAWTIPAQPADEALPQASYVKLGAADDLAFRQGDILAVAGRLEDMAAIAAIAGPEVADQGALTVPLDHAQVVVTGASLPGRELSELRSADFAGQVAVHHLERGGVPIPFGLRVKLRRGDVLFVSGVRSAVDQLASLAGNALSPCASSELLGLAAGMILGFLLGAISVPIGDASVGLGPAGGMLVAGIVVSLVSPVLRFAAGAPGTARHLVEALGLAGFTATVAISAGATLAVQVPVDVAVKLAVAGVGVSALAAIAAWGVGHHLLRINPAVLLGAIAGSHSSDAAARHAANAMGSSVPWIGFPAAQAAAAILLTALGYAAAMLAV